jgi:hypothetical protein
VIVFISIKKLSKKFFFIKRADGVCSCKKKESSLLKRQNSSESNLFKIKIGLNGGPDLTAAAFILTRKGL